MICYGLLWSLMWLLYRVICSVTYLDQLWPLSSHNLTPFLLPSLPFSPALRILYSLPSLPCPYPLQSLRSLVLPLLTLHSSIKCPRADRRQTPQELRMLSSVTIDCHEFRFSIVRFVISVSKVTSLQACLFNCLRSLVLPLLAFHSSFACPRADREQKTQVVGAGENIGWKKERSAGYLRESNQISSAKVTCHSKVFQRVYLFWKNHHNRKNQIRCIEL